MIACPVVPVRDKRERERERRVRERVREIREREE